MTTSLITFDLKVLIKVLREILPNEIFVIKWLCMRNALTSELAHKAFNSVEEAWLPIVAV